MNIDSLFPNDKNLLAELANDPRGTSISKNPSGQEKNYSNVLRKVYQSARQQFPQADSAEQAMELLTIQRFQDDEEKIKNLEKINDVNQKRLAVIGKDNKQLQQTLKSTQQALGSEEQDNEAREKRFQAYINKMSARDSELSKRIDNIGQAEVNDVEGKREQELRAQIKNLEARRAQAKITNPEEAKKIDHQLNIFKQELEQETKQEVEKIAVAKDEVEKLKQQFNPKNFEKRVDAASKELKQELDNVVKPQLQKQTNMLHWAKDAIETLSQNQLDAEKEQPVAQNPATQQAGLTFQAESINEEEEDWMLPRLSSNNPRMIQMMANKGKEVTDPKRGGIIGRIVDADGFKYQLEDALGNRFWVKPADINIPSDQPREPKQVSIFDKPKSQEEMFERKKMKKEQDVVEDLLNVFQQRLDKEKKYSEQPRATASQPVLDYSGDPLEQEVDGKMSPVDDFKKQMKHPVSPGSRGTYNLGRSYKGNPGMPYEPLDENQQSPVVDFRKQLANPTTPGSQAMPHWATPGQQYLEDGAGDMAGYSLEDLKHLAKSDKRAAKELARRRKLGENQTIRKDRWITEIYESI
jgi:hypothetical protein